MNRPWMQLHTRDWLDNKELRRCSPLARAVLSDLMCLAHEGEPYGHLSDKAGALTVKYMASRCVVTTGQFLRAVSELVKYRRIAQSEEGRISIPRMVEDERVRMARAAGGVKGGNPSLVPGKVNLPDNQEGLPASRARVDARSDSGNESKVLSFPENHGSRFRKLYDAHIVPGFQQDGAYLYSKIIGEAVNPEKTAELIDQSHAEWMKFFLENPKEWRPGIGRWLSDAYYTKKPAAKARDSPEPRKSRGIQAFTDEFGMLVDRQGNPLP